VDHKRNSYIKPKVVPVKSVDKLYKNWRGQKRKRIFLCDLTHVSQIVANEIFPLNIGYIGAYAQKQFGDQVEVKLFKYPHKLTEAFRESPPDLIGFSNYMWNADLSYSFAECIKKEYPHIPIICGGPNFPSVLSEQERHLKGHPVIDMFVYKDAEKPFVSIIQSLMGTGSLRETKMANLPSAHAIVDGKHYHGKLADRIKDLHLIPSPFLEGFFDDFFDGKMMCMIQSNRGCPFLCTFCVEGLVYYNKVYRFESDRFHKEMEYMARHKNVNGNLFLADSNFGMYKEDEDISYAIADVHKRYGFPEYIFCTTGKNQHSRILKCSKILKGLIRVSASVQSTNKEVLKTVKRSNISSTTLIDLAEAAKESEANTYADVILGLPGDSKKAHFETVQGLVNAGIDTLSLFTSILLDSTEMATGESRDKFKVKTRFRVLPRCFGTYKLGDDEFTSVETEEVTVENISLPIEDYLECRNMDFIVGIFYNDRMFYEMHALLKQVNIPTFDWLLEIYSRRASFPKKLMAVYQRFQYESNAELHDNREKLLADIKSNKKLLQKYIGGIEGNNVLYCAKAGVLVDSVQDAHDVAYVAGRKLLRERCPDILNQYDDYLTELKKYSELKKVDPFDLKKESVGKFHYDFLELQKKDYRITPKRFSKPIEIHFAHTETQRKHIAAQLKVYGTSRGGIARILPRNPVKRLYRTIRLT